MRASQQNRSLQDHVSWAQADLALLQVAGDVLWQGGSCMLAATWAGQDRGLFACRLLRCPGEDGGPFWGNLHFGGVLCDCCHACQHSTDTAEQEAADVV